MIQRSSSEVDVKTDDISFKGGQTIIFAGSSQEVKRIKELLLKKALLQTEILSSDLKGSERDKVIKGFKNFDFGVLISTDDVVARGCNVAGDFHVVNVM